MTRILCLGLIAAWIGGAAFTGTAAAQATAKQLFETGHAAYRVGDYERAVEQWTQAYELDPQPLLQYNLGQAYERLGMLDEAIEATSRYLEDTSPHDPNRGDAVGRLAKMTQRLEQTGILVRSEVEGAIIEIDGEDRARTPRADPVRVKPGQHTVVVRHPDHGEYRTEVRLAAGKVVEVNAVLSGTSAREGRATKERLRPLPAWILTGVGGAAVLTGVSLGAVALGKAKDAPASTGSAADSARGLSTAADVLLFGGVAMAAGGTLWLILGKKKTEAPVDGVSVRLLPVATSSALGFNLSGEF